MRHYEVSGTVSVKYPPEAKPADLRHPHRQKATTKRMNYNANFLAAGDRVAIKAAYRWLKTITKKWVDVPMNTQGCMVITSVDVKLQDKSQYINEHGDVVPMLAHGRIIQHDKLKGDALSRLIASLPLQKP